MYFLLPLLIIAILLEGVVTALPLVLVCLLCLTIFKRDASIFPIAFLSGVFLDILTIQKIGGASIFFLVFVLLILLYQRKYEINSYPFVLAASFVGSMLFLLFYGGEGVFMRGIISSILSVFLFIVVRILVRK